jgi:hypothetical protein
MWNIKTISFPRMHYFSILFWKKQKILYLTEPYTKIKDESLIY